MVEVNVQNRMIENGFGGNERLSRCRHCGGDIFYLVLFKESRVWWHESLKMD